MALYTLLAAHRNGLDVYRQRFGSAPPPPGRVIRLSSETEAAKPSDKGKGKWKGKKRSTAAKKPGLRIDDYDDPQGFSEERNRRQRGRKGAKGRKNQPESVMSDRPHAPYTQSEPGKPVASGRSAAKRAMAPAPDVAALKEKLIKAGIIVPKGTPKDDAKYIKMTTFPFPMPNPNEMMGANGLAAVLGYTPESAERYHQQPKSIRDSYGLLKEPVPQASPEINDGLQPVFGDYQHTERGFASYLREIGAANIAIDKGKE